MKIIVHSPGSQNIRLWFPSRLALNSATALLLPEMMKQNGITITRKQAQAMVRAIHTCRRNNPGWKIVEVQSANGDHVEIAL